MKTHEATREAEVTERLVEDPSTRTTGPRPRSLGYLVKRAVLGPALPTSHLAHERLGKPTALAVFASDGLSSVAYATEEILKVMVPVVGVAAFGLVMPVTGGILVVLAILLFSYRQTIKAYPSAGGAYIVTKDNFGPVPAQIAGVALLTDYVLTVAVSTAAGIAAITSAFPALYPYRVWMSVAAIWLIAWGNLRGVRESGRMFMVPTYYFIGMMLLLLVTGVARILTGSLEPLAVPRDVGETTGAIGIFLVLHAFASGGAALSGVEAVSNGIPAFRPPEWRNARTTLMWLGGLLGLMFFGLSYLAVHLEVVPAETRTVISQVGRAVFGSGTLGFVLFLMLQIATTAILILAANTSFADFPRLANFHATDRFLPRQLTTRGHRLVFSNGIIALAVVAAALVIGFRADVHRLIPLYAIGVFTSFTMSQAGMARHHLRVKEPRWRRGLAINGIGAVTTAVVAVVIAVTKFTHGAWAVIVFVPVAVWILTRTNQRYQQEHADLEDRLTPFVHRPPKRPVTVLVVDELDRAAIHALQYAKTIRTGPVHAVHLRRDGSSDALERRWHELGIDVPLEAIGNGGSVPTSVAEYVGSLPDDADVNVVIPSPATMDVLERILHRIATARLTRALLPFRNARMTLIHDHPGPGHVVTEALNGYQRLRVLPRLSHRAIVLVDRVDRASIRAVRYALALGATDVWAVHAALDREREQEIIRRWMELRLPVPLDVIECWDRDVARSLERYVAEMAGRRTEITVVMPRREYAELRQRLLHDRTSRKIARALGRYEHVDIAVVPFSFGHRRQASRAG